jgi:hypothetical protein
MLQKLRAYIQEMGITDTFYHDMVNTEPSSMLLYLGDKIEKLVPKSDPTYEEIMVSHRAREYGVDTAEMRRRIKDAVDNCVVHRGWLTCNEAKRWGLSELVFSERDKKAEVQCKLSDDEENILKGVKRKEIPDHPLHQRRTTCIRTIMLGR